tara:strand:+ start:269 stop:718 length:450 start_codon:yes stop_codon:yes gene_type:complete
MTHLKVGDKAPEFDTTNQEGEKIKLSDFKGKKVILYFYPKDNTPGCTMQACNLKDNIDALNNANYVVLGVSNDSQKSHQKFIDKYELPFDLLMDEDKNIVNMYGVYGQKKFMGRVYDGIHRITFVINEEGMIDNVIEKVKTKDHTAQII